MTIKIAHKLFFIIFVAGLIISAAIISINWFGFERNFNQYRLNKETQSIQPLINIISQQYQQVGFTPLNKTQWRQLKKQLHNTKPNLATNHLLQRMIIIDQQQRLFF